MQSLKRLYFYKLTNKNKGVKNQTLEWLYSR